MKIYKASNWLTSAALLALTLTAHSETGSFSTLSYNVAGLPQGLSSAESDRQPATELISCYVNEFDIVHVQEDFNYHAALYDTCNTHPFRSPTTGGMGFGSGLNIMSRFLYENWARVSWNNCNGVDCLTPKGFTLASVQIAEGVYVDVYNLHTQAQTAEADLSARRANVLQLANYIEQNSAGNAVIIFGDANTRYTRAGDNMQELLNRGFKDVWVELVRDGNVPQAGSNALVCDPKVTDANCEIVDKVLYRDNGYVNLQPSFYSIREDDETSAGLKLSDHPPVQTNWIYSTPENRKMSNSFGGPHGTAFNDVSLLPNQPQVNKVSLRAGRRVDRVEIELNNSQVLSHGGNGGSLTTLELDNNEYLRQLHVCLGQLNGRTRVFYARFTSSQGRSLSGGSSTGQCTTFDAPSGWQIVGFHGRSGAELDKVGVIYAPL